MRGKNFAVRRNTEAETKMYVSDLAIGIWLAVMTHSYLFVMSRCSGRVMETSSFRLCPITVKALIKTLLKNNYDLQWRLV